MEKTEEMENSANLIESTPLKNIDVSIIYQEKKKSYKRYTSNEDINVTDRGPISPDNNTTIETPTTVTVPNIFFSQLSFSENGTVLGITKILKIHTQK
jgi:hypothetical protein